MTATEAYELTTRGGATDFARVIAACGTFGPYCLIGGLAVNCYVEPVYTLDADLVIVAETSTTIAQHFAGMGFQVEVHPHSINLEPETSDLRVQFTTDTRYQPFPARAVTAEVLGVQTKVACLEDVTQGKLWAYSDPNGHLSKRKKDELDLIRLAEAYAGLRAAYPASLLELIDRG